MGQRGRIVAIVVAGLSLLLVAGAAAGKAPGGAVVDDWYDNGKLDRSWSCDLLLSGLTSMSENRRPGYFSMQADIERQLRARCAAWRGSVSRAESTAPAGRVPWNGSVSDKAVFESDPGRDAPLSELNSADADAGMTIYRLPWDLVLVGAVAGGLTVLIGAVLTSGRRLRPW